VGQAWRRPARAGAGAGEESGDDRLARLHHAPTDPLASSPAIREQGSIEASPCLGKKPPAKAGSRDRVLTDDELKLIWQEAGKLGWPFGPIVQVLMLTAQRRGEVAAMQWDDLDLDKGVWTIPADRTKNAKPHAVPLSKAARALIAGLPRYDQSAYGFPARGKPEQPYSGYSKGKRMLDAAIDARRRKEAVEARSEERRVGKECRRLCRSRWSPYH
jgi:integrase